MSRSRFAILSITLAILPVLSAAEKPDKAFHTGRADEYAHQTSDQVTVGAKPFNTEDLTMQAFGKNAEFMKYGVLPVLVVIQNKRAKTLNLQNLDVNLVGADGSHIKPVSAEDLPYLAAHPHSQQIPGVPKLPLPKKKNALSSPEIVGRAFALGMVPSGDSASGFFYFEAKAERGDKLYLSGMRDTPSGQEILYFEFEIGQ